MFFFLDIKCPVLSSWDGLITSNPNTSIGTVVQVRCTTGMVIKGSKENVTMSQCDLQGNWDPPIPKCLGIIFPDTILMQSQLSTVTLKCVF